LMIASRLLRYVLAGVLLVLGLFCGASDANAQSSNAVRIVVPYGPGSPPDVVTRLVAGELAQSTRWRVTVENRPGALATIGMGDVLKQPADGRTLILLDIAMTAAPAVFPHLGLRVENDFAPVIKISKDCSVLVVNPSVPARSVAELVAVIKSQPDKFTFSSGSFGTPAHLIGEMFKLQTGVRATHVPYQGSQQRLVDLIAGTNQVDFLSTSLAVDLVATGKRRALAVTAPTRIAALKDVPTVVEQGFPELVVEGWFGLAVRSGTAAEVITRLNEAVNAILARPKIHNALAKLGGEPAGGSAAEFETFVKAQVAHWGKVVRESGITTPR
jgi:tripartite-type tricarboxylate transporter receptor subunit TctC